MLCDCVLCIREERNVIYKCIPSLEVYCFACKLIVIVSTYTHTHSPLKNFRLNQSFIPQSLNLKKK